VTDILQYDFMRIALIMAVLIGLTAPAVGTFIVQRRLALLGDGIGHVALTGVGLGLLTSTSPVLGAVVVSALGAVAIEVLRARSRSGGDVALALLFYGGLSGGVILTNLAGGNGSGLQAYLFGSISSVSRGDLYVVGILTVVVLGIIALFGRELFLLCQDEDVARASGLPVRFLSLLIAVIAAVTVVIAMRAIGLLLVSALMVVPVAAAQQLTRGFKSTMLLAMGIGVLSAVSGLVGSFQYSIPPGPSIVVLAMTVFVAAVLGGILTRRRRSPGRGAEAGAEAEVAR
jgi:zinc transport system permease protein